MDEAKINDTTYRFDAADGEPCINLTSIEGFSHIPLVTLEEATAPLTNIVSRINAYVYLAKQHDKNPANNLTIDESASIALYTMEWTSYTDSLYYILNHTLCLEDRQSLKPWFLYLKLFLTALVRLPSVSLTVYHGLRNEDKYQINKEIIWWGFSSCSKIQTIAQDRKTLFIIDSIKVKDISKHSYFQNDQEVLL